MKKIEINTDFIQLDQLLKLAGVVNSGGQVKLMIVEKSVTLNDVLVIERRKKVFIGDIVKIEGGGIWQVVRKQEG